MNLQTFFKSNHTISPTYESISNYFTSEPYYFKVRDDGNLYIMTYNESKSNMNDPLVRECRGIILEKETNHIVCYTFDKGYDTQHTAEQTSEQPAQSLPQSTTHYETSIDGTQIRVFYYNNKWHLATTRKIDAYKSRWYSKKSFGVLFEEAIKHMYPEFDNYTKFYDKLDKYCCYSFVLKHPENNIVVIYQTPSLVHVMTRSMITLLEMTYNIQYAKHNKLDDVMEYPTILCQTHDEFTQLMDHNRTQQTNDIKYEGVMIVEFMASIPVPIKRTKVLYEDYKILKSLRGNSQSNFYRFLELRNTPQLQLYLTYYNQYEREFMKYEMDLYKMAKDIQTTYYHRFIVKDISNQNVPYEFRPILYYLHGQHINTHQQTTINTVIEYLNTLQPQQICFIYNRYKER